MTSKAKQIVDEILDEANEKSNKSMRAIKDGGYQKPAEMILLEALISFQREILFRLDEIESKLNN